MKRLTFLMIIFAVTCQAALCSESPAQSVNPAKEVPLLERYEFKDKHDPNGIGKFYMGREIARVMTFHGSPWLERPEREEEERLTKLVELLKLKPGMHVADIGAGSGVITLMMAKEVHDTGKVYAVEIQQEMLDLIQKKLDAGQIKNIELVKSTEKSPKLAENSIDLALFVDVYHELDFPYEMLLELKKCLKQGGQIVLVEYRKEDPEVPIKLVHKMSEAQAKIELELPELGFKWKVTHPDLPRQHVLVFEKQ